MSQQSICSNYPSLDLIRCFMISYIAFSPSRIKRSSTLIVYCTDIKLAKIVSIGDANSDSRITLCSFSLEWTLGSSYLIQVLIFLETSNNFGVFSPNILRQSLLTLSILTKTVQARASSSITIRITAAMKLIP